MRMLYSDVLAVMKSVLRSSPPKQTLAGPSRHIELFEFLADGAVDVNLTTGCRIDISFHVDLHPIAALRDRFLKELRGCSRMPVAIIDLRSRRMRNAV